MTACPSVNTGLFILSGRRHTRPVQRRLRGLQQCPECDGDGCSPCDEGWVEVVAVPPLDVPAIVVYYVLPDGQTSLGRCVDCAFEAFDEG